MKLICRLLAPFFFLLVATAAGAQYRLVTGTAKAALADSPAPLVLRSRPVALDLLALAKAANERGATLSVAFFDDATYDVVIDHTEATLSGGTAYVGYVVGHPLYPMIIVDNAGTVSIRYARPDRRLSIRGSAETGYVAREHVIYDKPEHPPGADSSYYGPLAPPAIQAKNAISLNNLVPVFVPPPETARDTNNILDVMVVYTPAALTYKGGTAAMNADIDAEIAQANTAYLNSNVVQRLRLVYRGPVTYTEVNMDTDLPRLGSAGDGFLDEVPVLRDLYKADFVSMWGMYTDYCGLGFLMADETASNVASLGYNIVSGDCVGPGAITFPHELGHNMGLRHEHYQDTTCLTPSAPLPPANCYSTVVTPEGSTTATQIDYAQGYVDLVNRFRTIMSYGTQCGDLGYYCNSILQFSNPALSFNNHASYGPAVLAPTGTLGTVSPLLRASNEHQALNDTRETTQNFRSPALASLTGPGILVSLTSSYTVAEGAGSVAIPVQRHVGSTGAVSVNYATSSGTATSGLDFTATSGTLNWAAGDTSVQTINVPIIQDSIVEGSEIFTVTLSGATGGASVGAAAGTSQSITVRIIDDEPDVFPVGALLPGGYNSPNVPNANMPSSVWSVDLTDGFASPASLRSAQAYAPDSSFTTFGNSDLTYTGVFLAGNVTFQYKLSGYQSSFSGFVFMVDGVVIGAASNTVGGEVPWTGASTPIAAGTHTLTWRFQNKLYFPCATASPAATGGAACADRAWVDNISLPLAKRLDFSGDGKTDLLWSKTDGQAAIWLMNGVASTSSAGIIGAGSGWSVKHVADFDGNGKGDLVWQHTDGSAAIWLMNGVSATSSALILGAGSGWSVVQTPDLNGDGKADIVWQHTDGSVAVWLMNGTAMTSGAGLVGPGTGWSVTKVADFDGDGKDDLLWTHTDGRVALWLMNGTTAKSSAVILGAGSGWSVKHTPDLDGDGRADIVWQHTDGSVAVWLMNGTAMTSSAGVLGAGSGWSVARAADFDGDGKADFLWQHTDGSTAIWLMNGTTATSSAGLIGAGSGWSVKRTADLNGDRKADIIWQHTDGSTAAWLMNGTTASGSAILLGPASGWSVSGVSQ
jgi:Calx-beta domain/FG-GAP-like repeat/Metallo-peptidase family M12B Reprolysin-like